MPLTNRPGSAVADVSVSSRVYVTEPAAASAFFEMNTRPAVVAAQRVPVSLGARSTAATLPPERSAAEEVAVRRAGARGGLAPPTSRKSAQPGWLPGVVNSGELASRSA